MIDETDVQTGARGTGRGLAAGAAEARETALPDRLLRIRVQYKILLANTGILLITATICSTLIVGYLQSERSVLTLGLFVLVGLLGISVSFPLHLSVLRLALGPLAVLESTARRVEGGDFEARAPLSPLADPEMARLVSVFNRLLDSVGTDRQRLREVAARAFRAQEAERARLARELQEEWAQRLASAQLRLRLARRSDDRAARERILDELRADLAETTTSLRDYARGLHPPALRELGPSAAIHSLVRSLSDGCRPAIELDGCELRGVLSADQELALYRIVQEALLNALRHAGASRVELRIRTDEEGVDVVVADDGKGFDTAAVAEADPCLGLFGMQERALYAHGTVAVESAVGQGTRVRVWLPRADAGCRPLVPSARAHEAEEAPPAAAVA